MIEVKNASKSYGSHVVVDDVSVTIEKKSITSLIGPNGAGKSTLLSMMSRMLPFDSGTVSIDGKPLKAYSTNELARKISTLKQTNNINLRLTVEELVAFGRFPYSNGRIKPHDQEKIDMAIEYMQLQSIRNKYIGHLSGGQRQAAFIAMVVAQDTDYIFLDEPLNNLDMKHSVNIMQLLQRLVTELGKTIVIVVHDINFASCYSDYIIAMKDGKLVHAGTKDDIIDPKILKDVFDLDIRIAEIENTRLCMYFNTEHVCMSDECVCFQDIIPLQNGVTKTVQNREKVTADAI